MTSSRTIAAALLCAGVLFPPGGDAQADAEPLTLERTLALFHEDGPALALARSHLSRALADARQSRAFPNPTATLTHEDVGGYSERYVHVQQRVDFLWGLGARDRSAEAGRDAARASFAVDSARLVLEVALTHVDAWAWRERIEALRTHGLLTDELLKAAEARLTEGDLAGHVVRRLRVERARVEGRALAAEHELGYAEQRLATLLGSLPPERVRAVAPAGPPPEVDSELDAVARASARRGEIAEAAAAVDAGVATEALVGGGWMTGASLTGGIKQQSDGREGLFVGVQLPVPFVDRRGGAREAARAAVEGARVATELTRRTIGAEAALAFSRYQGVRALAGGLAEAVRRDGEALLQSLRTAYAEGEVELTDVLQAAELAHEAAEVAIERRAAAWRAYFELEHAVGGLPDRAGPDRGGAR